MFFLIEQTFLVRKSKRKIVNIKYLPKFVKNNKITNLRQKFEGKIVDIK